MDALNYVFGGIGLVVLLGAAYLYHLYTKATTALTAANETVERLKSDLTIRDAELAAKTRVIAEMQKAGLSQYYESIEKDRIMLDKAPVDVVISEMQSILTKKDK